MITYNKEETDGFGSSLHRLLSIYCICRHYKFKYVHTFFRDIRYQGIKALEKNENDREFVKKVNQRFYKKSDIDLAKIRYKVIQKDISIKEIYDLEKLDTNIIVILTFPFYITDKLPNIYHHAKLFYKAKIKKNEEFTIGIHVRRGELFCVDSHRMMPNDYYIENTLKILKVLKSYNFNFKIELYTEVPDNEITVTGEHPGIINRISESVILKPEDNKIEEFDILPNLDKYINEDILTTFDRMVNSDILLLSKSSLSFSAAIIKEGTSVYKKFWHNLPDGNINSDSETFEKDIDKFILFYLLKKNHNFEL